MYHKWCVVVIICCLLEGVLSLCVQDQNCFLPKCQCQQKTPPSGVPTAEIPQIVMFAYDDAVRSKELGYYNRLFSSDRHNPNGCPITMTLFLQDNNTEYGAVRELYKRGMEVAVHSITHKSPQSLWKNMSEGELRREIRGQKLNIHDKAGIPLNEIRGWRSPFLQPSGDDQYKVLTDPTYGFTYDSSLAAEKRKLTEESMWPYTLDFGAQISCGTPPCPEGRFPGLWEFPVIPMIDNENYPRIYVDAYRPGTENDSYRYLLRNFESYYKGSRSPFMVNMHAAWFAYEENLKGMDRFIQYLLTKMDVYIITIQQALEWLKYPVGLSAVKEFHPWNCEAPDGGEPGGVIGLDKKFTFSPASTFGMETPSSLCVQDVNCRLPSCRCGNSGNPGNIPNTKIPQMVLFTFDGPINDLNIDFYNKLFPKWRKNPNGSPTGVTVFLSDTSTDYDLVRELYSRGVEIAVHSSIQNSSSAFWRDALPDELEREIVKQRRTINELAGIPFKHIQGWRSPFLQPSGDRLFAVLEHNDFTYDSSLTTLKTSLSDQTDWPFTLDFGWNNNCLTEPCPNGRYPGLWVLPVVNMVNHQTGLPCRYVDSCRPGNKTIALDYLWRNFYSYYTGNRAPFMLNMHTSWFQMNPEYLAAMNEFVDGLTNLDDVYIVTIQQSLQWLQQPTKLSDIQSFSPWYEQERKTYVKTDDGDPGKPDWIVVVLVVIAAIFGACVVITISMHIVRKYQLRKRANSIREAITVTSDRNSVTDWLNAFPRRFSQVSCPTVDTFESHTRGYGYDNVDFDMDEDRESSTDSPVKLQLSPTNSLTLNPELLKTNYSRDLAIWNKQEKKIPHIVNKSQKKKPYTNGEMCLNVDNIRVDGSKSKMKQKQENGSHKPWTFVWDPCKSLTHSESALKPRKHDKRTECRDSHSNKMPASYVRHSGDLTRDARNDRVRHSGRYDFYNSDNNNTDYSDSETSLTPRYTRHSSEIESSEASTCITMLEKALESELADLESTKPYADDKRTVSPVVRRDIVKSDQRKRPSSTGHNCELGNSRHTKSFRYKSEDQRVKSPPKSSGGADDRSHKSRGRKNHRRSSDLSDSRPRYTRDLMPDRGRQDPRVTHEVEEEWERELGKQLGKFLKSKHALKGLEHYR